MAALTDNIDVTVYTCWRKDDMTIVIDVYYYESSIKVIIVLPVEKAKELTNKLIWHLRTVKKLRRPAPHASIATNEKFRWFLEQVEKAR